MRRTLVVLRTTQFSVLRRSDGTPEKLNPFTTDGKMSESFEKVVKDIEADVYKTQGWKPKITDYDRPKWDRYDAIERDDDPAAFDAKMRRSADSKPPFVRTIEVAKLEQTTAPKEYWYPEPEPPEVVAQRRQVHIAIAVGLCTMFVLFYLVTCTHIQLSEHF